MTILNDDDLPVNYKILSDELWNYFEGSIAGSSQPGYYWIVTTPDQIVLENLKKEINLKEAGVDPWMDEEFNALNEEKIDVIYSLASAKYDRDPLLLKWIWENKFNKTLITTINNISLEIADFDAASIEQLTVISEDAISRIKNGEKILITCGAGIGRTGTILAAIFMEFTGIYDTNLAISYIRKIYSLNAVEGEVQYNALNKFAEFNKSIVHEENINISSIINKLNLKDNLNLNFKNVEHTSLIEAVQSGDLKLIKTLLEKKLDVNKKIDDTYPLIEAAKIGKPSIVELLIKSGADVNVYDSQGHTALIKSIMNLSKVSLKVIFILLKNKAIINKQDAYGHDALFYCNHLKDKNNKYKKELLLKAGAKLV